LNESKEESFAEELPDNHRWNEQDQKHSKLDYVLGLEPQDWIVLQVAHVDFRLELHQFRMLLDQQPANVGEEEASTRIERVPISVSELVVSSVDRRFTSRACQPTTLLTDDIEPKSTCRSAQNTNAKRSARLEEVCWL
jgi:hypothetical protein